MTRHSFLVDPSLPIAIMALLAYIGPHIQGILEFMTCPIQDAIIGVLQFNRSLIQDQKFASTSTPRM